MKETNTTWKANLYNDKHAFVYQYGEGLIDLLTPKEGERILDVGCGSGQLTAKISELGATVIGIDSSREMIADAKQKYTHIEFLVMDAVDFHFNEPFDAILSNAVLHWVLEKEEAIKSMYRSLKAGGRLVAEFGGKGNVQTIVNQLRLSLAKRGYEENANLALWYFPSVGEYTSLLEKHGFRVTLAQHYDRPTELADCESGIKDWLEMFGNAFFNDVPPAAKEAIKSEVQQSIKGKLYSNGKWYADYKRIRVVAIKE
ncbi:methyltransferase domain-containing protein [Rhodocytophaga aerolata]|uniref:Methyltransferase domain-containing protein n=1 Tax=Rhodocytophaga aerolata TaxID=455078 RepID=A0ABT8R507_9BACT|nr:class I SAM-dependent methyltransferase [Rhodocytophaga aerolata]MDO1446323.1 methyltransferase domain-containing protein [Rhodocytophaga aerolata]